MLTIQDVQALPEKYPVEVTTTYPRFMATGSDVQLPRPIYLTIHFKEVVPELWEMLMTESFEYAPAIEGVRQSADNKLFPAYRERLDAVNERRKELGAHLLRD